MHEPSAGGVPHTSHPGGPPAGIVIHLEYRVRSAVERRRSVRRRGGRWPYYERRRRNRRFGERRCGREPRLDRAALAVLRRVAVFDESARRLIAQAYPGAPTPDCIAAERRRNAGAGSCAGR